MVFSSISGVVDSFKNFKNLNLPTDNSTGTQLDTVDKLKVKEENWNRMFIILNGKGALKVKFQKKINFDCGNIIKSWCLLSIPELQNK